MKLLSKLSIAAALAFSGIAIAQNTNTTQTTLNYDATNARIGINTASPRAALEVSGSTAGTNVLLIAPSAVTPTASVTGSLVMNSNGRLCQIMNTTTGVCTSLASPSTVTFVPAN